MYCVYVHLCISVCVFVGTLVELFVDVCVHRVRMLPLQPYGIVFARVYVCILYIERKIHTFSWHENSSLLTPGGVLHDALWIFHSAICSFELDAVSATAATTATAVAAASAFRFECFRFFFVVFCTYVCVRVWSPFVSLSLDKIFTTKLSRTNPIIRCTNVVCVQQHKKKDCCVRIALHNVFTWYHTDSDFRSTWRLIFVFSRYVSVCVWYACVRCDTFYELAQW